MNKKFLFLVIITLISLLYTVLDYLEITRYFKVKYYSNDRYLKNYRTINRVDEKDKIVILLDTNVNRINNIKPSLNSILDQTTKVDEIAVNILEGENSFINTDLHRIINVYNIGNGYENKTCNLLIPTLLREKEANTIILILKDNVVYGKNFIYKMLKKAINNPNNIIVSNKNNATIIRPKFFQAESFDPDLVEFNDQWFENSIYVDKILVSENRNYKF